MTINEAMTKANEAGYTHDMGPAYKATYFLDPSFWQSLGKALRWEKRQWYYNTFSKGEENNDGWRVNWHRFIDHLAEGGRAETFFETLT
jgi:hypothetical protein